MEMLGFTEALVAVLVVLLLGQFLNLQWVAKGLPPGPTPLPVLGNLWTLNFTLHHETLMKLAKTYGNTITLWMGHQPIVVVNGYEAVKDLLVSNSEATAGRAKTPFVLDYGHEQGVLAANGETWKQQRRCSVTMLRSLGVGKKSLENRIQEEARHMAEALASLEGKPSDLENMIASFVTNVIAAVVFGHRFTLDDDALHQLTKAANEVGPFLSSFWGQVYEAFPQLMRRLPGPHQKVFVQLEYVRNYAIKEVRAHEESPADAPQDFIDLYLDQISKTKGDTDNTYNEANMVQVVLDLFFAATETTGVTLLWALLYMVKYPDIQEKVQKELADVLEPSDIIQSEHRKKLPYTDAVIHEIMRCSGVVPLGLPRQCVKDTIIQGFPLKKGTTVIYNLFSVLHDHKHWELPEVFNPSRFLDKEGNFAKNEAFIPFSAGHRVCLGEQLARTELFIFFTNLLREFTFRLPEGVTKVNLDCTFGTVLHPHPNNICAVPNCAPAHHSA